MPFQDLPPECILLVVEMLTTGHPISESKSKPQNHPVSADVLALSNTCRRLRDGIWPRLIRKIQLPPSNYKIPDEIISSEARRHIRRIEVGGSSEGAAVEFGWFDQFNGFLSDCSGLESLYFNLDLRHRAEWDPQNPEGFMVVVPNVQELSTNWPGGGDEYPFQRFSCPGLKRLEMVGCIPHSTGPGLAEFITKTLPLEGDLDSLKHLKIKFSAIDIASHTLEAFFRKWNSKDRSALAASDTAGGALLPTLQSMSLDLTVQGHIEEADQDIDFNSDYGFDEEAEVKEVFDRPLIHAISYAIKSIVQAASIGHCRIVSDATETPQDPFFSSDDVLTTTIKEYVADCPDFTSCHLERVSCPKRLNCWSLDTQTDLLDLIIVDRDESGEIRLTRLEKEGREQRWNREMMIGTFS